MAFKGTTRAYKRMKNGMFWSEIASRFKIFEDYPPPPPPPPPAYRADPFLNLVCYACAY